MRLRAVLILAGVILGPVALFASGLSFQALKKEVVEQRLESFSRDDTQREVILKSMFAQVGCGDHLTEEAVKHVKQPDLICVLPGQTDETVIVGAHFDHVNAGAGVVDNWSGASLLPSLYQGLSQPSHAAHVRLRRLYRRGEGRTGIFGLCEAHDRR